MSSRESILGAIRAARLAPRARPAHVLPKISNDLLAQFSENVRRAGGTIAQISSQDDLPEHVFAHLMEAKSKPVLHIPAQSPLRSLPWHRAPGLTLTELPPSLDDTALGLADFGLSETGSVVFAAAVHRPSVWHFLPGREIVLLHGDDLVGRLEDALARLPGGTLPSSMVLVTGTSRTGDIEQTMERGAHGPRQIHVAITR